MLFLRNTFRFAAYSFLFLWLLLSVARVVKHGVLLLTEAPLYPEPVNTGADFLFFKNRYDSFKLP